MDLSSLDSILDQEIMDISPVTTRPPQKLNYSHEAMIDLIIAKPWISQDEIALSFGYSPSWISTIFTSDAFQAKLAERTKVLVDPVVQASVAERFKSMVLRSQEILMEKLSQPAKLIPDNLALRTMELASRALGYGARPDVAAPSTVNVNLHLEQLGGNLTTLLARKKSEAITFDNPEPPNG